MPGVSFLHSADVVNGPIVLCFPVRVPSQYEESRKVRSKPQRANDKDEFGVADLRRIEETSNCFEDDGEAEGNEEDGIEESAKNLCS